MKDKNLPIYILLFVIVIILIWIAITYNIHINELNRLLSERGNISITTSNDSFVGTALTIIGILVTFVIGYQIYNAVELKSGIYNEIDIKVKELKKEFNILKEGYNKKISEVNMSILDPKLNINLFWYKDFDRQLLDYKNMLYRNGWSDETKLLYYQTCISICIQKINLLSEIRSLIDELNSNKEMPDCISNITDEICLYLKKVCELNYKLLNDPSFTKITEDSFNDKDNPNIKGLIDTYRSIAHMKTKEEMITSIDNYLKERNRAFLNY